MALPLGTIVVVNPKGVDDANRLIAVDPKTGAQKLLAQDGMFVLPQYVAFAADGRVLVSDYEAFGTGGLIAVDPATGQQTKVVASTVFQGPNGIAVDLAGQVVVAYTRHSPPGAHSKVMRVNPANGDHRDVAPGARFTEPQDVAVDASGNVVLAVLKFSVSVPSKLYYIGQGSGASILAEGKPPGADYVAVAVEPTGNIVVVNNPQRQLLRYHRTYTTMTIVSEGNKIWNPWAVAVEANGAILVSDGKNGILRVDPGSGQQTSVSTGGYLAGPVGRGPRGLAVRR